MISQKFLVVCTVLLGTGLMYSPVVQPNGDTSGEDRASGVAPALVDNPRSDEGINFEELYRRRGEELQTLHKECEIKDEKIRDLQYTAQHSLHDVSRNFVPIGSTWKRWLPVYPDTDWRSKLPDWMCEVPDQGHSKWLDIAGLFVFTTAASLWHENLKGMNSAKSGKQLVAILRNMIPWGEVRYSLQRRTVNFSVGAGVYCLSRFAYFKSQEAKQALVQGLHKDQALADKDKLIEKLKKQMEEREKNKITPFD